MKISTLNGIYVVTDGFARGKNALESENTEYRRDREKRPQEQGEIQTRHQSCFGWGVFEKSFLTG